MKKLWEKPDRLLILPIALMLGVVFIAILTVLLKPGGGAAVLLLDHYAQPPKDYPFIYPFTIQNLMHLILFAGLGEVYTRWRIARHEEAALAEKLLPESYEVVLQSHDLAPIRKAVSSRYDAEHGFLASLVDISILQFLASRSVDQTVSVLNSSLELLIHRVDLRYSMLRYITWLIPTIGFIGTVIGIALSLNLVDPGAETQPLGDIANSLGVSFYTTLVALAESAILVFLLNIVQAKEERAVNFAGHYTLKNLINRLYAGG